MEGWTTALEIDFLQTLGTHKKDAPKSIKDVSKEQRRFLLEQYKKSMSLRARWGSIDKAVVGKEVDWQIASLSSP